MFETENLNKNLNFADVDVCRAIKEMEANGFAVMQKVIPDAVCDALIENLVKMAERQSREHEDDPLKHNNSHNSLLSGQLIIRNVILYEPDVFMPFIDLAPVMDVLSLTFRQPAILDGCLASFATPPNKKYDRPIHIDSYIAPTDLRDTLDVVVFFCLNEMTSTNGATKIWPGSHKSGIQVQRDPGLSDGNVEGSVQLLAPKGSIAFILGQTWHQIGENVDSEDRWVLINHYKRWWLKPKTDFTRCGADIFDKLNDNQKELFGFNSIPPKDLVTRGAILTKKEDIPSNYDDARSQ